MKKIIFTLVVLFGTIAYAKPTVVVSILPQQTFVKKIAKDMLDVTLMVKPGSSPHSYEPKSSQMIALSKADLYFSIGIEFEKNWLPKFKSQNPNLKFIDMSEKVSKLEISEYHHHEHEGEHHEEEAHGGLDPHTWTSPKNVETMAHTIYNALVKIDPKNRDNYKKNLINFIQEIRNTDLQIKDILKDIKPKSKFIVFHPSWGYFANEYDLIQIAVEMEGKSPKPKEMIMIIEEAKEENVQVIFTQPEFSDKSAKIIAKELGIKVQKISPLNPKWSKNLINMAKAIAKKQ